MKRNWRTCKFDGKRRQNGRNRYEDRKKKSVSFVNEILTLKQMRCR